MKKLFLNKPPVRKIACAVPGSFSETVYRPYRLLLGTCAIIAALSAFQSCSAPDLAGGGTIETTNGFVATVMYPDSTPASGATVRVRARDYLAYSAILAKTVPVQQLTAITGPDGTIRTGSLIQGDYIIEVNDNQSNALLLPLSVRDEEAHTDFGSVFMGHYSTVRGKPAAAAGKQYAQIYGLERIVSAGSDGAFEIDDLPEGVYTLRFIQSKDDPDPVIIDSVETKAGESTELQFSAWKHRTDIYINTSSEGAAVASDVYRFPLLLQIDTGSIDFSGATDDGRDVRFTKMDGTLIPYEIEHWDQTSGKAFVWVLVDTVFGNNAGQRIRMYWGNSQASAVSSGSDVFQPQNGFAGVWHFTSATAGSYPDATGNGNTGTRDKHIASFEPAAIGDAAVFTDSGQYIDCGNGTTLALQGQVTISAWVKLSDLSDRYNWLVAKKDSLGVTDGYVLECNPGRQSGFVTLIGQDSTLVRGYLGDSLTPGFRWEAQWYHFTVVARSGKDAVYFNGVNIANYFMEPLNITSGPASLLIGGKGHDWTNGAIDEVRVESVSRNDAWIRLSYETQRGDQKTVVFK